MIMRQWTRDWGLETRMLFTMFLLAAVYLLFLACALVLWE